MKKIFSSILVLLLAVAIFADSGEVVNGIIEVADSEKFPAGHFGQAAGYLPGDSIFVTNPESGVTLQFLNLGTLDSAEGVVILLSEESAKTLGIEKGSSMRCKLNMRYGGFDETVVGQAVIDSEDAMLAKKAKEQAELAKNPPKTLKTEEENVVSEVAELEVDNVVAAPIAGVPLFEEETLEEESTEEIIDENQIENTPTQESIIESIPLAADEVEDASEEEAVADFETEEEVITKEEPIAEEVIDEIVVEEPVAEEVIEDYENEDAAFTETKNAVEQPSPAEIAETEELEEELVSEEIPEEVGIVDEPEVETIEEEIVVPSEVVETEELPPLEEEKLSTEDEVVQEESEAELEPVAEISEEVVDDEYTPIVLVPTEPIAPETVEEDVVEEIKEPESIEVTESTEVVNIEPEESYKNLIVNSESDLKKGFWYIQIASLGSSENLEKLVRKHSKYPLILVPNGKGAYRVLVGPLNIDEYAAALEKFKSYGYKDAFLKKK